MAKASSTAQWYQQLRKPGWAPPTTLFGKVWSALYVTIAIGFGYVLWRVVGGVIPSVVAVPIILNLLFNAAFTPIQFGLRSNGLALADILLTDITLLWAMLAIWPHVAWVTILLIPYLLWALFATVLQISITILNTGR